MAVGVCVGVSAGMSVWVSVWVSIGMTMRMSVGSDRMGDSGLECGGDRGSDRGREGGGARCQMHKRQMPGEGAGDASSSAMAERCTADCTTPTARHLRRPAQPGPAQPDLPLLWRREVLRHGAGRAGLVGAPRVVLGQGARWKWRWDTVGKSGGGTRWVRMEVGHGG